MSETLVILGIVACAVSGVPGLFLDRRSPVGQWLAALLAVAGCLLGLAGVAAFWYGDSGPEISLPWAIPGGPFRVGVDALSALFLVPIFVIALLGSIYGLDYWKQSDHPDNGRKLRLFYGLLAAGMALLVIARNGLLFLMGWEIMALAAFFLVTTEDHEEEVRTIGLLYLFTTHVSTLALFALFAILRSTTGSFELRSLSTEEIGPGAMTAVLVLGLIAFGIKAGVMPLHTWLPGAHTVTPSHVSAIMSGVIIKMGIYGLVRVTSLLPPAPVEWGGIVLALGALSGVLGVAYAIGQHDLKRLLAYHSIENIGIIVMGIGLALLGRAHARPDWIVLGLGGALLHVWNHAFFKALLFLSAGAVVHATHTREIDHLGGLAKSMPRTALCFLVGAVAICGLPPLNGFVSEFLLYLGLFHALGLEGGPTVIGTAFAIPALALIGALALACFVKVFGAVFLGTPRSDHASHAHEAGMLMGGPMLALVALCVLIGLVPALIEPVLIGAVRAWAPETSAASLASHAPLGWISVMALVLLGAVLCAGLGLRFLLGRRPLDAGPTWGCGYAAPTPRMQYTSSSFAQILVGLFAWALRPRRLAPGTLPLFPPPTAFRSDVPDVVLEEGIYPTFRLGATLFAWLRLFQQGSIQAYLLYILLTLIALLLCG